jgi:small conductance mechanosensitive channel
VNLNEIIQKLQEDPAGYIGGFVAEHGSSILIALLIWFVGRWLARVVAGVVQRLLLRAKVDATLAGFFRNICYAALVIFVAIAALSKLGIETGSLIAVIGAAGLAVAFALQGSLANFAAGIMIIMFRPFRVGDVVEAAGVAGIVEEIQIFSTVLRTPDNKRVFVPNSAITGGNIVNVTANPTRRVDMTFGVAYGEDLARVRRTLERILAENPKVLRDPAPLIAVGALADSSVNFLVRPWARTADYWDVYFGVHESVKREFDREGISIPFPQRDVHLRRPARAKA